MENSVNFKSGYVGIVGKPNVGKSTLLNKLVGQKIAIVSPKPQTTRNKILAIMSDETYQVVFTDTPGFHKPKNKLGENMIKAVDDTISDVDLILMVVEPEELISTAEERILEKIDKISIINKMYDAQEEKIDKIIKQTNEKLLGKLTDINIEKIIKKYNEAEDIKEMFNKIEDNYNIKISQYNREMYKQGFIDGMQLIIESFNDSGTGLPQRECP